MSRSRTYTLFILGCLFIYLLIFRKSEEYSHRGGKVNYSSPNIKGFARIFSSKCSNENVAQYAIVMDAGSTGSRIHVYRFNYCKGKGVPVLEDEVFITTKPGLSSFTKDMDGAVASISVLMKAALRSVPKEFYHCTPVTLKATAGLRMLSDGMGEKILSRVSTLLKNEFPFPIFEEDGVVIMGGDQEGIFAWITLNYLLGRIGGKSANRLPTAGIMDLGGGSTQIVFEEPDVPQGDHRVDLEFNGEKYVLYQHSYDGYGLMQGRKSINQASKKNGKGAVCLPKNSKLEFDEVILHGSATDFEECRELISSKVFSKNQEWCYTPPCAFDGVYMPPLGDHHELYAFSYFYDKFTEPFEIGDSDQSVASFLVGQIKTAANDICSPSPPKNLGTEGMKELRKNKEWCMDLGYMYSLLSVGYSLPDSRKISSVKKVDGIEIGWSLGCAIKMLEKSAKCTAPS